MKPIKKSLLNQLIAIALIIFTIFFVNVGLILPKSLLPVYEKNIYNYLKQPLYLVNNDLKNNDIDDNKIAYIFIDQNNEIHSSYNIKNIIDCDLDKLIDYIRNDYGKFKYKGKTYYYNTSYNQNRKKIAITDNQYIKQIKTDIYQNIFPIFSMTFILVFVLILFWAHKLVSKIEHLKVKIDNLDNDDYTDNYKYIVYDELKVLSEAIDNMRINLKKDEEYKNQMYQNISHDFKTPLTVIKSYIEAIEDGIQDEKEGMDIIKEQIKKLELKVHSLLYLNKLNYLKDLKSYENEHVNVSIVIRTCIDKFKLQRPDINWEVHLEDKNNIFNGTYDMWETIIDNLLNNFMRYTDKVIRITVKNNKIVLYNDGDIIDEKILNDLFTPYKKGIKGQFGLGLSIVKKTITLFGYDIIVKNEKRGVSFIIK